MTQKVKVGNTVYQFPDNMTDDQIKAALQKELGPPTQQAGQSQGSLDVLRNMVNGQPNTPQMPTFGSGLSRFGQFAKDQLGNASNFARAITGMTAPEGVRGMPTYTSGLSQASQFAKGQGQNADNFARSLANGITVGWSNELAAGANTLSGLGSGKNYMQNLAAENARTAKIPPAGRLTGEMMGAALTGDLAGGLGLSLMRGARPALTSLIPRAAAEGAAYGSIYGAGEAKPGERLKGAAQGALWGAGTGALTSALPYPFLRKPKTNPETMRAQAGANFDAAHASGMRINQSSVRDVTAKIGELAKSEGFHKGLHPRAATALKELADYADKPSGISVQDYHTIRKLFQRAKNGSADRDERRILRDIVSTLDQHMKGLTPTDVAGAANPQEAIGQLHQGIETWARLRKGDVIQELMDRAKVKAGQFSVSGYENGLRQQFRQLAMNEKKMRVFSPEEQKAIKAVAAGGGMRNMMRLLGKFAVRGPISGATGAAAGFYTGNPALTAGIWGLGEAGKAASTAMTKGRAMTALEMALSGKPPPTLSPKQGALLDALIASEQAAAPR